MYEGIKQLRSALMEQKAVIEKATAALHAEADAVRAQMAPLETKLRDITKQIKEIEVKAGLREISMEIAACARALPTNRTLVNEGAAPVPTSTPAEQPDQAEA